MNIREIIKDWIDFIIGFGMPMIIENWDLLSEEDYCTLSLEEIQQKEKEIIKELREKIKRL